MIEYLSDLGLSIPCKKVMKIENGLGNIIVEKQNCNKGVSIPDNLTQNSCLHFAIDNQTDLGPLQHPRWSAS